MTVIERYRACWTGSWASVLDDEARAVPTVIARCGDMSDAEMIARALNTRGAVKAEREWCRQIIDVDQRDKGDGRLLATLANMAATRLRELGGQ